MKPLICEMCGSHDVVKQNGLFVCQYCGTKYSIEEAKKMMVEGTVKIDNSDRLSNLYQLARRAKLENNEKNAAKYYEMILLEEPTSWEASFYSVYFSAIQTNIAGISSAAYKITNSIPTALLLIKNNLVDRNDVRNAVADIASRVADAAAMLFTGTMNHYKQFSNVTNANNEKISRVRSIIEMLFLTGDTIEELFDYDRELCKESACACWKLAFTCYESCNMPAPSNGLEYLEKIRRYEPSYASSKSLNSNDGGCYVATAVYGSYDCPEVWTLRRFRDNTLATTWYGRTFIHIYYAISPTLVKRFGHIKLFRLIWKRKLDRMVTSLQERGIESTPYEDISW